MSAETDTQRCGDPTCRTNVQCVYPDYTLCGRRQGATDRGPGTDHDDTEAIKSELAGHIFWSRNGLGSNAAGCSCGVEYAWNERKSAHEEHRFEVLAAYVARQVEAVERERDEAVTTAECNHLAKVEWRHEAQPNPHARRGYRRRDARILTLLDALEVAERERDEAREERDYHHARADVLLAKVSGRVALRGGKPGDYWREWHLSHCGAAQAAATAEQQRDEARAVIERVLADCDGAIAQESVLGEQVVTVRWLQAALALATEPEGVGTGAGGGAPRQDTGSAWDNRSEGCPEDPAQAHPLTLDEHLAEVERRIETEPLLATPGVNTTRAVIRMIHDYREAVRRG